MMTPILLLSLLAIEPGQPLPVLKGDFLSGKKAVLPAAAKGKAVMYALGFSYDSRFAVEAWVARYKKDFGADTRITFFEVPVIGGMGVLAKPFIDRGMRSGTPKEFHENVVTIYSGSGELRKVMNVKNEKAASIVLTDKDGIVRWRYEGMLDETKYLEMKKAADGLVAGH